MVFLKIPNVTIPSVIQNQVTNGHVTCKIIISVTPLLFSILQMISPKGLHRLSSHFHRLLKETSSLITNQDSGVHLFTLTSLLLHTTMHVCTYYLCTFIVLFILLMYTYYDINVNSITPIRAKYLNSTEGHYWSGKEV